MATCESCGRDEPTVTKVQRVYLIPGSDVGDDTPPARIEESGTATPGDIELWCASCCATFPHIVIEET